MGLQTRLFSKRMMWIMLGILALSIAIIAIGNWVRYLQEFGDNQRNESVYLQGFDQPDAFGDSFTQATYLDQGWSPEQSMYFYNTSQGSNLIPYDFFLFIEQADSTELFRSAPNINRFRYLAQKPSSLNPDGLPVGFVKDTYKGLGSKSIDYVGYTCAACHTNQVNIQQDNGESIAVRIDGGPAMADMVRFLEALSASFDKTIADTQKRERFIRNVLARDNYEDAAEVEQDLKRFALRLKMYNAINRSVSYDEEGKRHRTQYGYARLDAFGRIFNRVIEHLLTLEQIQARLLSIKELNQQDVTQITQDIGNQLLSAEQRERIVLATYETLIKKGRSPQGALKVMLKSLRDSDFNYANAPVSYPFLWDIAQHDYVQWNGIAANAGVGPLGRNTGEVIGVFATLDWHEEQRCGLAARISGQCSLFGKPAKKDLIRFTSSVDSRGLRKIEHLLAELSSPQWEDKALAGVLPAIDKEQAAKGEAIFTERCVMCHQRIDRTDPYRKVVAFMGDVDKVGTDPTMAMNSVNYQGKSGLLENLYTGTPVDLNLVVQDTMPVAALLTLTTEGVVATPDPDKSWLRARVDWLFNIVDAFEKNDIKASAKMGDYRSSTATDPLAPLKAYKGRPMNGIWTTAPYLHNGSVPTLYDLFLPAECSPQQPNCMKRPSTFEVGSRVLDVEKVGMKHSGYKGSTFDTSLPGNSNKGHEYAACGTKIPNKPAGWQCKPLDHQQRMALVEYMKTL
ncbi:MAG: di-heme-cytochrome C peroxidase [Pontibacterium sp.]